MIRNPTVAQFPFTIPIPRPIPGSCASCEEPLDTTKKLPSQPKNDRLATKENGILKKCRTEKCRTVNLLASTSPMIYFPQITESLSSPGASCLLSIHDIDYTHVVRFQIKISQVALSLRIGHFSLWVMRMVLVVCFLNDALSTHFNILKVSYPHVSLTPPMLCPLVR